MGFPAARGPGLAAKGALVYTFVVAEHGHPTVERGLVWKTKFVVSNLFVAREVLPQEMTFEFRGQPVRVLLVHDPEEGTKDPRFPASIEEVQVVVEGDTKIQVASSKVQNGKVMLGLHDQVAADLREKVQAQKVFAIAAFGAWLQMVRFQTYDSEVGRPMLHSPSRSSKTTVDTTAGEHVTLGHSPSARCGPAIIEVEMWRRIEDALNRDPELPLHQILLSDAEEQLRLEDVRRAIIDAAVAAEAYMKSHLPKKYKGLMMGKLLKKFEDALDPRDRVRFNALGLDQLKKCRNDFMHQGHAQVTVQDASNLVNGVSELFELKPSSS